MMNTTQMMMNCFIAGMCFTALVGLGAYGIYTAVKEFILENGK